MARTNRTKALVVGAAWALFLAGCRENPDPEGAKKLLDRVNAEKFQTWTRAPGYETRQVSRTAHSDNVDIFVNPTLAAAIADKATKSTWPEGSVIVKEGFDDDGKRQLVAIMEKRADGWYWAEYSDDGDPLYSGKPSICTDCHASGADFVRAFGFPE